MKNRSLKALVLAAAVSGVLAGLATPVHASGTATTPTSMEQPMADVNSAVQQAIQAKLASDANFAESDLTTSVTGDLVVLTGRVRDLLAHERALKIAQSYAGERQVVDHLRVERIYPWTR